jgi:hypothetical protein
VEISNTGDFTTVLNAFTVEGTSTLYPATPALNWSSDYYWRVSGLNAEGAIIGSTSDVGSFSTPSYTAPELTSPLSNISTSRPLFIWNGISGAAGYSIQVSNNNSFTEILWETQLSGTSIVYGAENPLAFNATYYWRVRGLNSEGEPLGQWSNTGSFNIVTTNIVNLISPVNSDVYTLTPTLTWEALNGAAKYGVWIYANEELSSLMWSTNQITGTSVSYPSQGAPSLAFGSSYYWRAVALDVNGNPLGDPSTPARFTVSSTLVPVLLSPVNETVSNLTPTFNWEAIEGVSRFRIQVSANETFNLILWDNNNVSVNSAVYPSSGVQPLQYALSYYWRVSSLNDAGIALGDFSAPAQFTTPSGEIQLELIFGP